MCYILLCLFSFYFRFFFVNCFSCILFMFADCLRLTSRTNAEQLIICGARGFCFLPLALRFLLPRFTLSLSFSFSLCFALLAHCLLCFTVLGFAFVALAGDGDGVSFHNSFPVGAGNASSTLAQVGVRVRFGGWLLFWRSGRSGCCPNRWIRQWVQGRGLPCVRRPVVIYDIQIDANAAPQPPNTKKGDNSVLRPATSRTRVRVGVCTSVGIVAQKNRYICIFDTLRLESQSGQMISSGTPIIASIYQTQLTTYRVYRLSSQPDRGAETSLIWIVARPTC